MMKPAVAPMVKPAYMDGIRMFEGEPAGTGLHFAWQGFICSIVINDHFDSGVGHVKNMHREKESLPHPRSSRMERRSLWSLGM